MTRTEIINALIIKYGYESYLEIGLWDCRNFASINCERKIGIDPFVQSSCAEQQYKAGQSIWQLTSDDFFRGFEDKLDVVFLDGDHRHEQVRKDLANAFDRLTVGGSIILHDANPPTELHTLDHRPLNEWNGTVYKIVSAWIKYGLYSAQTYTVDTDWGCAVIRKTSDLQVAKMFKLWSYTPTWQEFDANRKQLLNLVSVEEFRKIEGL